MEERKIITKTAAVCENGHIISSDVSEGENPPPCCGKCGGVVYTTCPKCGKEIPGNSYWVHYDYGVPNISMKKILTQANFPIHCEECGESYPWAMGEK